MLSMWRGGRPQGRVEFHSLVIGYGTAWRPVNGSRQGTAVGKLGGGTGAKDKLDEVANPNEAGSLQQGPTALHTVPDEKIRATHA